MRQLMISMVLATDMSVHFSLMDEFNAALAALPNLADWQDRNLLCRLIVHLADIANPARGFTFAKKWAERVIVEFLQQVGAHSGSPQAHSHELGTCALVVLCCVTVLLVSVSSPGNLLPCWLAWLLKKPFAAVSHRVTKRRRWACR